MNQQPIKDEEGVRVGQQGVTFPTKGKLCIKMDSQKIL
jgi:hypothetical protein